MSSTFLAMRNAQRHVEDFDAVMRDHYEAQDCADCEDFLRMGIDAFEWVCRADEVARAAIYAGCVEHDQHIDEAVETLLRNWLNPCEFAFKWIENTESKGFTINNVEKFRRCYEEVIAIVKSFDNPELEASDAIANAREEAIREHDNGETAEFV